MLEVFVAQIPQNGEMGVLFPKSRHEEVQAVKNQKVKREKYYAWLLLEKAIAQVFQKPMQDFSFEKCNTGKWLCDQFEFSLSHSHGVVAVAISDFPVGVDIQKIQCVQGDIADKILMEEELKRYQTLEKAGKMEEKTQFLLACFCKKESLFKQKNQIKCDFNTFKNLQGKTEITTLVFGENRYCLSVAMGSAFVKNQMRVQEITL